MPATASLSHPPVRHFTRSLLAGITLLIVPALHAEDKALAPAWDQASSFLFNDAVQSFQKAPASANPRERDYGIAVAMLNYQPQTDANIQGALETFQRLASENPTDRIGILSRFFTGRIPQLHFPTPDIPTALAVYYPLVKDRTGNVVAEACAARIVYLETYANPSLKDPIAKLIELEPLVENLSTREGVRSFHFAMGYAYLNYSKRSDADNLRRALVHLKEAEKGGFPRWQDEANLLMAIAEASLLSGDKAQAAAYYGRFAGKFKRDSRNYYARQQLKALSPAAAVATPSPTSSPTP